MLRLLKWLALAVLALVVVAIAAVAVAVTVIDPNDYRDEIATAVERQTGRELRIEGEIGWSFFPWVGVEAGRTTLADAEGFYDEPFLEIDGLEVAIKLWPLLRGRLETRPLVLERPVVRLMRNAEGRGNWEELAERLAGAEGASGEADQPEASEPATGEGEEGDGDDTAEGPNRLLSSAVIGGVRLEDGVLQWRDEASGQAITVDPLNLRLDTLRLGEPATLRVDALIGGEERLELTADGRVELREGEPWVAADWQLAPLNPKGLLAALGQPAPETADPAALTRVAGEGRVVATPQRLELERLDLALDGTELQGEAAVDDWDGPAVRFAAEVDTLDVDRYLPPPAEENGAEGEADGGSAPAGEGGGDGGESPLTALKAVELDFPLEPLRSLQLDGRLAIGELRASGLRLESVGAQLSGADGRLGAESLEAELYQGAYSGSLWLDARGAEPAVELEQTLREVAFAPLLEDLAGRDWLHGTGRFHLEGAGGGADVGALIEDFDGAGELAVEEGAVLGLNIPQRVREAAARVRGEEPPAPPDESARTDFSSLTATLDIGGGAVRNDDLRMASPVLRAAGQGQADLLAETVDYRLQVTPAEGLGKSEEPLLRRLGGTEVPVAITGSLLAPEVGINLREALDAEARERLGALEEELEEEAGQARDQAERELEEEREELEKELEGERDELKDKARQELKGLFE